MASSAAFYVAEVDPATGREIEDSRVQVDSPAEGYELIDILASRRATRRTRYVLVVQDDGPGAPIRCTACHQIIESRS